MSGASLLVLPARGAFRLPAVAVSHGWFQTAPFAWDPAAGILSRTERLEGGPVGLRRIEPAGRYRGLGLAWATLRAWQRETGLVSP